MKSWVALFKNNLLLALRDRSVIFFNYLFPLIFFFAFAELFRAGVGGGIAFFVCTVLTMGILGNGLWGAGMRSVQDREAGILRRYKVTPVTPVRMLAASMVSGWLLYLPVLVLLIGLARFIYGMPVPARWLSLAVMASLGVLAFRAIGLIVAAAANTMQEAVIAVQLLYMPMLFLSGATIPAAMLPGWAQEAAQFLPASYLVTAFQGMLLRDQTLAENWPAVAAMVLTIVLGMFLSCQLFRWEKEERIGGRARASVLAVLGPFLVMGIWEGFSHEQVERNQALWRDLQRSTVFLIRNARIFDGAGRVIESGAVLVENGKIARVWEGEAPPPRALHAEVVEGAGKTLLPGLIDAGVRLELTGAAEETGPREAIPRALAALLYSGVTAARSAGDDPEAVAEWRARIGSGQRLGAQPVAGGPEAKTPGSRLPDAALARMARKGVALAPGLAAAEAAAQWAAGDPQALERSLAAQVLPKPWIEATRKALAQAAVDSGRKAELEAAAEQARDNLRRAHAAGVRLAAGSGSGAMLVFHGAALHRELQLWVEAGIPPAAALEGATGNAARLLGAPDRLGRIAQARDADLLLVDGNPLEDIAATERISLVVLKGERVRRGTLFDQE